MPFQTPSLHHVTATTVGDQDDLDFLVGTLGLALVKQTINFDDHAVYHFYYADAAGTPGSVMTTFPYGRKDVRQSTDGVLFEVATDGPGFDLDESAGALGLPPGVDDEEAVRAALPDVTIPTP